MAVGRTTLATREIKGNHTMAKATTTKNKTHYLKSGVVYTGPTHKTKGNLMTGARHTANSKMLSHTKPKKRA